MQFYYLLFVTTNDDELDKKNENIDKNHQKTNISSE